MKFAGLILICASSCLALILPAVGVVQFPKVSRGGMAQIPNTSPNSINRADGLPVSTTSNTWAPHQAITNELLPNHVPSPFPNAAPEAVANQVPVENRSVLDMKLGMGIWLLLAPACLLGLAMWTFGPMPSGSRTK